MFNTGNCASVPLVANIDGNGNNGWGGDGGWLWIIVVFALLFGWGNGGFGGWGGNNGGGYVATAATQADIQRGFDNSAVISKLDGITNGLCDGNNYPEPRRLLKKTVPCQRGEDVKWLQCELVYHGFLVRKDIDGIFGKDTANAVGRFQKKVGIKVDKKCGVVTISYLKATN